TQQQEYKADGQQRLDHAEDIVDHLPSTVDRRRTPCGFARHAEVFGAHDLLAVRPGDPLLIDTMRRLHRVTGRIHLSLTIDVAPVRGRSDVRPTMIFTLSHNLSSLVSG